MMKRSWRQSIAAIGGLLLGVIAYARWLAPYRPVLERISITLPPNARALAGLKIGFMTDLHVGPFIDQHDVERAARLLALESPDLVLYGGDYVSESPRYITGALKAMEQLARHAPLGAFAVLGNHDISTSLPKLEAAFGEISIELLRNEARPICFNGTRFWVVGIDETLLGSPDVERAYAEVPARDPTIALWHEAEFAEHAAARDSLLQLSGHSHGGQVRLPGIGALWLPVHGRRFVQGLVDADGMPIYTSRGVGVYRPPIRFRCPAEVTLVTLE
jgi:uncharacterized protein